MYEFAGFSYKDAKNYHAAIARAWLTADGFNSLYEQRHVLRFISDGELAASAVDGWSLDEDAGFSVQELKAAFAVLRQELLPELIVGKEAVA